MFNKTRKGRFTVPNLITIVFMLFLFSVFFEPMTMAFPSIAEAEGVSQILTAAVMNSLPILFILVIFASPFILRERRKIVQEQGNRRPDRR